jgi:hypothetical protein
VNDIHVYSIQTYKKQISYDYYYQIVTHEVCDVRMLRGMCEWRMCECWQRGLSCGGIKKMYMAPFT